MAWMETQNAAPEPPLQGVFDFETGRQNGFENWRHEQEQRLEAVRREWGLPVGHPVRVRLWNVDQEFEGRLQLGHHPVTLDRRLALHLRLGRLEFTSTDIEQCTRLD